MRPSTSAAPAATSRQPRIYYGWAIVGVAFLTAAMSGGLVATFGFFIKPMEAELGWSRTAMLGAATVGTLAGAVVGPLIGPLVDRHGARVLAVGAGLLAGLALGLVYTVHHLWAFYILYGAASALLMGGLSQVLTGMVVPKWFVRKRGRALANATLGFAVAGVALGPLAQVLVATAGWRTTWIIYGSAVVLLVAVPGGLLLRRQPEDLGLVPDGDPPPSAASEVAAKKEPAWTAGAAARTPALWLMLGAFGLASFATGPFFLNLVPFLQGQGFSPALVGGAWSTYFACSFASKWAWGFVAERVHIRRCMMVSFAGEMLSIGLALLAHNPASLFLFAVAGGIGHGPFPQFSTQIWADYFGRPFLGTIRGLFSPPMVLASAAGPLVTGRVFDLTQSYRPIFLVFLGLLAVGLVCIYLARPPQQPSGAAAKG
jgi:MFS family permease